MNTDFYPLTINKVEKLTADSIAVSFELPDSLKDKFKYIHGQHITLKTEINGEEVRRSYSLCGDPAQSEIRVGIKQIENGLFSSYAINELKVGMQIEVMAPQGHFYTELNPANKKHYMLIAAGSGITPNLSHLQAILNTERDSRVTLIYQNQSTPKMMFREALAFLKNKYMERFQWINVFSREDSESEILNGRMSAKKLEAMEAAKLIQLGTVDEVFLCGPQAMILSLVDALMAKGLSKDNIHYELFFAGDKDPDSEKLAAERAEKFHDKKASIALKVGGRTTRFELAMDGDSVLDAAVEAGADVPFSCKGGVCATCKAKVTKGKVEMDMNHSLTEQEVAEGMILTCQSHPVSDDVEIDFDFAH